MPAMASMLCLFLALLCGPQDAVLMTQFSWFPGQLPADWVRAMEGTDRSGRERKAMACVAALVVDMSAWGSSTFQPAYAISAST